MIKIK
jgi:hypothetical protein